MIELLLTYKYLFLIPLAIVEGPIVIIVCGFLVTLGIMNPFIAYFITVLGDIAGDAMFYYAGYSGKGILRYFKISEEKLEKAKQYFRNNHKKAILTSKLVHGIGFTGLIAAGASHVPFKKYIRIGTIISLAQSLIFLGIGMIFGHTYVAIGKYLNYYAAGVSVLLLALILYIFIARNRISKKVTV